MKHIAFIPARLGSQGIKLKNRKLFQYTSSFIKKLTWINEVVVSTDDHHIEKEALRNKFSYYPRKKKISGNKCSIKSVICDYVAKANLSNDDIIWLLYLTIPFRKLKDFKYAKKIIEEKKINSLISFIPVETHPFNCWFLKNNKIYQYIDNNLYRRQDLPKAYYHHHYLCSFKVKVLHKLNNELIFSNTYPLILNGDINHLLEIDNQKDLIKFKNLK
tara:strand:+ start:573 stop:1223 length:651 start_codon:yes stop_codon:yes gene_type:complete